tara:strand:+ start:738 stop:1430 length:693 start_codon:yes stop_codon:yes gene_type:complete
MEETVRAKLLSDPSIILDDQELMERLLTATDIKLGTNVVDLRHVAMNRLSDKLGELEGTHRSVVAAAYQNLLGTKQIHQGVVHLLSKKSLDDFVICLKTELLRILSIDCIFILLEKPDGSEDPLIPTKFRPNIQTVMPGFVNTYITQGGVTDFSKAKIRRATSVTNQLFENASIKIESEACLQLNLNENQIVGMIAIGSSDKNFFEPGQGTDLLKFFACVCEKILEKWIN